MKEVYEEAQLIDENAHGINEKSSILLVASNEISSITQDVAAVTEEELAENQEINSQAMALKEMLRGIDQLLVRYRTAVIPVKEDSPKKLKFIMLSPLDHSFWRSLRQGVLYAESELKSKNVEIEYIGLNPMSNDKFVQIMNDKIEAGCDGIIVPGFVAGMDPYIEKAQKKNITILTFNCDLPDSSKRLAYFGPDVSHQGTLAGELMAKHCNNSGEVAIFFGNQNDSINKIRKDAVTASLKKRKIKIIAEVQAVDDNELVYNKAKEILSKYNNIKGIVITSGGAIGLARAIEEMGHETSTKIVCFDYDKEIFDLIKKDIVYAAMGQDPFGQGHDPIISLFNYFTANEIPDSITHTRIEVVDKRNVYDLA
jgi:methyl-accepting chemotaxis protein/ribose transport system substrate-binding protein